MTKNNEVKELREDIEKLKNTVKEMEQLLEKFTILVEFLTKKKLTVKFD